MVFHLAVCFMLVEHEKMHLHATSPQSTRFVEIFDYLLDKMFVRRIARSYKLYKISILNLLSDNHIAKHEAY
jgi:hypothetical protein